MCFLLPLSSIMQAGARIQQMWLQNIHVLWYWSFRFSSCIFSYLFSLLYTLQQERTSRNCVQSPAINTTGRDHLCSNHCYFMHQLSACYNRASLGWAKSAGNLLTSAELSCIHLSMAENSILWWVLLNWGDNLQFSLISGLFSILLVLVQTLLFKLSIIHPD